MELNEEVVLNKTPKTYNEYVGERILKVIGESEEEIIKLHEWGCILLENKTIDFTDAGLKEFIDLIIKIKLPVIITGEIIKKYKYGNNT
jgi:hypothetical protein